MSERDPMGGEPDPASPGAMAWSERMEHQSPAGGPPGGGMEPPTRRLRTMTGTSGRRRRPTSAGGAGPRSGPNRRGIPGLLTFALVLLATLAVTAIVLGNTDDDRTEADGTTGAAATGGAAPVTTEGAVPSPGAVTDPNATATVPVDPNATATVPVDPNATATVPVDPNATATVPVDPNATATVPVDPNATAAPPVTSAPAGPLGGDLGLSVPMSQPACDGTWVAFVGSSSDPARIVSDVQALLAAHPGSQYTLTRGGCTSLRQALPDGRDIYAVYLGPFADQASACAAATQAGNGAYVKRVDNSTPPEQFWAC